MIEIDLSTIPAENKAWHSQYANKTNYDSVRNFIMHGAYNEGRPEQWFPQTHDELGEIEIAFADAPKAVQEKLLPLLERFRAVVYAQHGTTEEVVQKYATTLLDHYGSKEVAANKMHAYGYGYSEVPRSLFPLIREAINSLPELETKEWEVTITETRTFTYTYKVSARGPHEASQKAEGSYSEDLKNGSLPEGTHAITGSGRANKTQVITP